MKKLLVILLTCFCMFTFSGVTMAMAQDTKQITEEKINLFPDGMTYDGKLNPKDVVDKTKYRPVFLGKTPDPRLFIVFSKALDLTAEFQYVAIVFFAADHVNPKVISVVYLDKSNKFHQIGLLQTVAKHYTEVPISEKDEGTFRLDFNNIFGLSLQKKLGV